MSTDLINSLILAGAFLVLFAIAEILYHYFKVKVEVTRKLVHIGTGLLTLLFPKMLNNQWWVLLLCSCFAVILIASQRFHFLKSINNIDRESIGSLAYPFSVYAAYWFYDHYSKSNTFFYLPVLVLAIADPMAALIGKRWPRGKYKVGTGYKSLSGSIACFVAAVIISGLVFLYNGDHLTGTVILKSLLIGLVAAIAEGVSGKGYDNITIPFSVLALLILFEQLKF